MIQSPFRESGAKAPITHDGACTIIPRRDLWDRLQSRLLQGATSMALPNTDNGLLVEVTSVGEGHPLVDLNQLEFCKVEGGEIERRPRKVEVGDICWIDGFHVGRQLMLGRKDHWQVDQDRMLAVMDTMEQELPRLIGRKLLVKRNDSWMLKVVMGDMDIEPPVDSDGTFVAGGGSDATRVTYQEVVSVGPETDGIAVGDLIAFGKDRGTVDITVHGQQYTILPKNLVTATMALAAENPKLLRRVSE